jgi:hypothetical protein
MLLIGRMTIIFANSSKQRSRASSTWRCRGRRPGWSGCGSSRGGAASVCASDTTRPRRGVSVEALSPAPLVSRTVVEAPDILITPFARGRFRAVGAAGCRFRLTWRHTRPADRKASPTASKRWDGVAGNFEPILCLSVSKSERRESGSCAKASISSQTDLTADRHASTSSLVGSRSKTSDAGEIVCWRTYCVNVAMAAAIGSLVIATLPSNPRFRRYSVDQRFFVFLVVR